MTDATAITRPPTFAVSGSAGETDRQGPRPAH
jgi:hypothetical protein